MVVPEPGFPTTLGVALSATTDQMTAVLVLDRRPAAVGTETWEDDFASDQSSDRASILCKMSTVWRRALATISGPSWGLVRGNPAARAVIR